MKAGWIREWRRRSQVEEGGRLSLERDSSAVEVERRLLRLISHFHALLEVPLVVEKLLFFYDGLRRTDQLRKGKEGRRRRGENPSESEEENELGKRGRRSEMDGEDIRGMKRRGLDVVVFCDGGWEIARQAEEAQARSFNRSAPFSLPA